MFIYKIPYSLVSKELNLRFSDEVLINGENQADAGRNLQELFNKLKEREKDELVLFIEIGNAELVSTLPPLIPIPC